jgi:hypothetical protein
VKVISKCIKIHMEGGGGGIRMCKPMGIIRLLKIKNSWVPWSLKSEHNMRKQVQLLSSVKGCMSKYARLLHMLSGIWYPSRVSIWCWCPPCTLTSHQQRLGSIPSAERNEWLCHPPWGHARAWEQSPSLVGLCDSTCRDRTSFGTSDMVTNAFDIDIRFSLVCCLYDWTVSTSNATVSTVVNKGNMFLKQDANIWYVIAKLCHANFVGDTIILYLIQA